MTQTDSISYFITSFIISVINLGIAHSRDSDDLNLISHFLILIF